jgi:hypothetical protein
LKKRVRELEVSLSPKPLFVEPLAMMVLRRRSLKKWLDQAPKSLKPQNFLIGIRRYVAENIDKRLGIMQEAWEIIVESWCHSWKDSHP